MKITEIDLDNMDILGEAIPPDVTENIGRAWYRFLAAEDTGDAGASLVWEYKNAGSDDAEPESEIVWAAGENSEAMKLLLEEYREQTAVAEAVRSFFEIPEESLTGSTASALSDAGFATKTVESRDIYVTVGELGELKLTKKGSPFYVKPLNDLTVRQFRNGVVDCLFHKRKGILEDLAWLPYDWFEPMVSSCIIMDEKAKGFLLVHKTKSGMLVPGLMFAFSDDSTKDVAELIRFSARAALENYPPETKVLLRRHDDKVRALADKLFPGRTGEKAVWGERSEGAEGRSL